MQIPSTGAAPRGSRYRGGAINGNNLIWRKLTVSPVSTNAIGVVGSQCARHVERVAEIEAYAAP